MKTANSLRDTARDEATRYMAENLIMQIEQIMPGLAEVGAWPIAGQPRAMRELGRAGVAPIVLPRALKAFTESLGNNSPHPVGDDV
jgi:hypothetical protein